MILYSLASDIVCVLLLCEMATKGLGKVNHSASFLVNKVCSSKLLHVSMTDVLNTTLKSQSVGERLPPKSVCTYNMKKEAILQCSGS